jgi:hypothetical protein
MARYCNEYFRAVRTCDNVLIALGRYREHDDAIEQLELQIMDDRIEALLGAREAAAPPPSRRVPA